jgi:hypothetical protein
MAIRCCANWCRQQHLNPERSVGFLPTTFSGCSIVCEQLRLNRAASTVSPSRGVLAQLVRAPPCHGGGCGFEPRRLRSFFLSFIAIRSATETWSFHALKRRQLTTAPRRQSAERGGRATWRNQSAPRASCSRNHIATVSSAKIPRSRDREAREFWSKRSQR